MAEITFRDAVISVRRWKVLALCAIWPGWYLHTWGSQRTARGSLSALLLAGARFASAAGTSPLLVSGVVVGTELSTFVFGVFLLRHGRMRDLGFNASDDDEFSH